MSGISQTARFLVVLLLCYAPLVAPRSVSASSPCILAESGPLVVTQDNAVIEKLRITSANGAALRIEGAANVTVRNVEIFHAGGAGIEFVDAPHLHILRVHVVNTDVPAVGANPSDELVNVVGESSPDVVIKRAKLERGSSGIYLLNSPRAHLQRIEGYDFRGPFPRGQLVQFDASDNAVLEDFYAENPTTTSWVEDNVSVYNSSNVTVRRGLLVGNNSPSGVGVMFEQHNTNVSGGLCEDVDTVDMGNGSFSGYPARNITFRRTRARDNHCVGQGGRDAPLSNSLVWAGSPDSEHLKVLKSVYFNLCNPDNIIWDTDVFDAVSLKERNFAPRAPVHLSFCWETNRESGFLSGLWDGHQVWRAFQFLTR